MKYMGFFKGPGILVALLVATITLSYPASAEAEESPEGSCENLLVQVDKEYSLSPLYVPPDMAFVSDYGVPSLGWDAMLRAEPAEHLAELVSVANSEGYELVLASSYRSFYDQSLAHGFYTDLYGAEADRMSALPGHSEHQLGNTVDFTNAEAGYQINQSFDDTEAARWLQENASEYGFALSYPMGEEEKTGYLWEPWHYRYIGVENARKVKEAGTDVRDLLLEQGVRPDCS